MQKLIITGSVPRGISAKPLTLMFNVHNDVTINGYCNSNDLHDLIRGLVSCICLTNDELFITAEVKMILGSVLLPELCQNHFHSA